MSKIHRVEIVGYKTNFLTRIKKAKFQIVNSVYGFKYIYKSFGCRSFIYPTDTLTSNEKKYIDKLLKNVDSKKRLLHLKFKKINVGDYIYDDYLRTYNQITVDVNSSEFKNYLKKTLCLCFFGIKN